MGGGLMQLVAYGAQDIYLTGNPQITFFKVVYRRHTNFSMESIRQTFSGTAGFGNDVTATISRNGDLVHRMYLEHDAAFLIGSGNCGLVERYGDSLIKECEIEIGGQKIDKHTSMWNRVWSDLTQYNPHGHFGEGATGASVRADGGGDDSQTNTTGTLYQLMTGNGLGLNSEVASNDNEVGTAASVEPNPPPAYLAAFKSPTSDQTVPFHSSVRADAAGLGNLPPNTRAEFLVSTVPPFPPEDIE